jgi:hypothetical protein
MEVAPGISIALLYNGVGSTAEGLGRITKAGVKCLNWRRGKVAVRMLCILYLLTICDFENVWKRRVRRESRVALWTVLV